MFALLFKVLAATICLTDGAQPRLVSDTTESASACTAMATSVDNAINGDDSGTCLLAEPGGCHCACAHTVPLPSTLAFTISAPTLHFDQSLPDSPFIPAAIVSLFRPPIA